MIKKPNELDFSNKKIAMIISGVAGIGKTTLALSSPKPLLIDLDKGISRVETRYRTDVDEVYNYDELLDDLKNNDLSAYETIVIDTGGKLLELMKPYVIAKDVKNGKRDGNLSLQGYGAVKREFASFINFIRSLNKHLIIVFHATEVQLADDITGLRIRIEGSSRDDVWDDIDIGGFVEMRGNKRTIGFSNCDRYYAKGTHGIHGVYDIPLLTEDTKNTFVTDLFNKILSDLNAEVNEYALYQKVMNAFAPAINEAHTIKEFNSLFQELQTAEHYLTSKKELWFALVEKGKGLGIVYDNESKQFARKETDNQD